jgi:hypothetical protein
MEYYANSAAFEDDIKFTETMNSLWEVKSSGQKISAGSTLKTFTYPNSSTIGGLLSESNTDSNLELLREQLKAHGARGFVGLQRKFRIMDDDGSKSLNLVEFKKGIKESGVNLTDLQISQLFTTFDKDRNGSVDFDEFLTTLRVRV